MSNKSIPDYLALDIPEVLTFLFHPRKDFSPTPGSKGEIIIPVDDNVSIGARLFFADTKVPTILFFHGNGEIVSDYDELGPIYIKMGINFLPVDYRGYGKSTGTPTVSTMMSDCHVIFKYINKWLGDHSFTGPFIIMGRSLGSASALELASSYGDNIDALIIESGFANIIPLLKLLGINTEGLGITDDGFSNIEKIIKFRKPTLIIHAEFDHIIPFSEGMDLFEASSAPDKTFQKIPDANHNTIFAYGIEKYTMAIKTLSDKITK